MCDQASISLIVDTDTIKLLETCLGGCSLMVEPQIPKLMAYLLALKQTFSFLPESATIGGLMLSVDRHIAYRSNRDTFNGRN